MRLGILRTGGPPPELMQFGSYPDMFRAWLGPDAFDYAEYDVEAGQLPASPEECPAYLVTGSRADAYGDERWVCELRASLVAAKGKARLLGICFGHQVMAQAFGGRVAKADEGWGIGAHTYETEADAAFGGGATMTLPASHQDQVVVAPSGAKIVAGSAFSPIGALSYPGQQALSRQLHPEFTCAFAAALVERQRGHGIDDAAADAALASLDQPNDSALAATAARDFLSGRRAV